MNEIAEIAALKAEIGTQDDTIKLLQASNIMLKEDIKDLNSNLEAAIELLDELNPQMSMTLPVIQLSEDFDTSE